MVLHGTPAAGNAVVGSLELNCNAIVFVQDSHHEKHFLIALTEKVAERLASGRARVFGNPFLRARVSAAIGKDSQKREQETTAMKGVSEVDKDDNDNEKGKDTKKEVKKKTKTGNKTKRKKVAKTTKTFSSS